MRRAASTLKTDVASTTRDGVSGKEVFQRRPTLEPRAPVIVFFSLQSAKGIKVQAGDARRNPHVSRCFASLFAGAEEGLF